MKSLKRFAESLSEIEFRCVVLLLILGLFVIVVAIGCHTERLKERVRELEAKVGRP